jgi:hypothetical protein
MKALFNEELLGRLFYASLLLFNDLGLELGHALHLKNERSYFYSAVRFCQAFLFLAAV